MSSRELLAHHVAAEQLELTLATKVFDHPPTPIAHPDLADRIEGMLLGLMIGDALGNRSEAMRPAVRAYEYGEIRDYLPNRHAGHRRVGTPSDDSQLALWTLESLLEHGGVNPDALAAKFCSRPIFGIGSAVREFIGNYRDAGKPWHEAGAARRVTAR